MGAFSEAQGAYAAHGIATFPVAVSANGADKRPAVNGWQRVGLVASRVLAEKFPGADALGFVGGSRSKLAVLDVDSPDERVLADAMDRAGSTPLVIKTARGRYQAWYRHNGEKRQIRPSPDKPVDVLGAGLVVAPPSVAGRSRYEIIQGSLDDVDRLPTMRVDAGGRIDGAGDSSAPVVLDGQRNKALFNFCGRAARGCGSFDELLTLARKEAATYFPPMEETEIVKTARSIWRYRENGTLRFGLTGAWIPTDETNALICSDQDALLLLAFLRANNAPGSRFLIANGLSETFGWTRKRFAGTRTRLEGKHIRIVRRPSRHAPALYIWAK